MDTQISQKPQSLQQADVGEGAVHQGLCRGRAVALQQGPVQAAAVDADADGDAVRPAAVRHGPHPFLSSDVAGVDADLRSPGLRRRNGQAVVEVDVRNQGQGRLPDDLPEGVRGLRIGDGETGNIATGGRQGPQLRQTRLHIRGLCIEHGLDGHRCGAADRHPAHANLLCQFSHGHFLKISIHTSWKVMKAMKASSSTMPAAWI